MLTAPEHCALPAHYDSPMSSNHKLDVAAAAAEHVASRGLIPVAASVTGSRLRGTDTTASDTDVLVLVAEKDLGRGRALTIAPRALAGQSDVEGQVQSLDRFLQLLPTSVPYVEFSRSPFMLTHPAYRPLISALRPDPHVLGVHAQRFIGHLHRRRSVPRDKRLRTTAAVYHLLRTGSPLCPRSYCDTGALPTEMLDWARQTLHEQGLFIEPGETNHV